MANISAENRFWSYWKYRAVRINKKWDDAKIFALSNYP